MEAEAIGVFITQFGAAGVALAWLAGTAQGRKVAAAIWTAIHETFAERPIYRYALVAMVLSLCLTAQVLVVWYAWWKAQTPR